MRLNLVQGQSAGGLLRQACRQFGVSGSVYVIDDDLSVGPLCDDATRDDWWAIVWQTTFGEPYRPNLYKQWQTLSELLQVQSTEELVIWSSVSARDHVLDRMAASMLTRYRGAMFRIAVPPNGTLSGVGLFAPEQLASCEPTKAPLEPATVARLAADFDDRLRNSVGVRLLEDGAMRALPDSGLDQVIVDSCPVEWVTWLRVLGSLIADCDGRNLIADFFFSWRLHCLAQAGKIEIQGTAGVPENWSNVLVRRSGAT